mmetsp:Transcript_22308/g.32932  ORF Transcript_22308/g.32932 Transcript_22308/m.32932 type:complete len:510 (-) Transcript_22308:79-1608(-)|eukprot:CAMPEP_0194246348 /NCGR_PEP_ID=MMETSP0158-20130606/14904_1 /TAXON_ID=33649 /ORGANISM="Thalassionema nitzschioides, Strain L26-B" /LENGTH=509 /DNA_ID=CAMNT_0038982225 /DNA_START=45 /DNA_END=1574 /DNA_ORIENTATION=+
MQFEQQRQQAHSQKIQSDFEKYVKDFPINLAFPARVSSSSPSRPVRTNVDLIQHRLLESGVLFSDLQQIDQVTAAVSEFITNMNDTGCFNAVQVKLEDNSKDKGEESSLHVVLNEKKWYKVYVGGGLKQDSIYQTSGDSLLPKVQFESSGTLQNLSGHLDRTSLSYTIDQTSAASLALSHDCPLYSYFPEDSIGYETILAMNNGSQYNLSCRAVLDTLDHEWTRSYKEYQRLLSMRISNSSIVGTPEMAPKSYVGIDWSLILRDVLPRRHATLPYTCDASPEVVLQSGSTAKHSLSFEYRTNGAYTDSRYNPTAGTDFHTKVEFAGPPGDVGFLKAEGGISHSVGREKGIAIHASAASGILQPLAFGGLCGPPTISDRFFIGGPMQLRGFVPAGIGPRAKTGGASTPRGDSLGGDFFYTASLAASVPFPPLAILQDSDIRLFGFCNCGTLTGLKSDAISVLKSTRLSLGGGVCMSSPFGRLEATYAAPIWYGPRDARRTVQIGVGFNFG